MPKPHGLCPACGLTEMLELVARNLVGLGWECPRCRYVQPGCRYKDCNKPISTPEQARQGNRVWGPMCKAHSRIGFKHHPKKKEKA